MKGFSALDKSILFLFATHRTLVVTLWFSSGCLFLSFSLFKFIT